VDHPFQPLARPPLRRQLIFLISVQALFLVGFETFPISPQRTRLQDIEKLVERGKYTEAESLAKVLVAEQATAAGYDLLAFISEMLGKLDQAELAYSKALSIDERFPSSRVRLAIVYGKEGKHSECIRMLESGSPRISEEPEALFYWCQSYLELGNTGKALEISAKVQQLSKKDPNALLSVAKLLLSKDLYTQATPLLRDTVRQLPESAEAHYSLALAFFKAREYEKMWSHVQKAQSLDPKGVRNWLLHAMGLIDIGDFAKAKESLQRVQQLQPENQSGRFLMSRVLLEEGAYEQAINTLNGLINAGFEDQNAHFLLLTAYRRNGEFQKAVEYSLKLTRLFPDSSATYLYAGLELEFLGELQRAEEFFRKAIALGEGSPEVALGARFSLATTLAKKGDHVGAASLLEDLVRENPADIPGRLELGDIYYRTKQYDAAFRVLREAVLLDPRNKRAQFQLGNTLTRLGRQSEAAVHFAVFRDLEQAQDLTEKSHSGVNTKNRK
jgi:tetratricopeptide (TPR) repeat protein